MKGCCSQAGSKGFSFQSFRAKVTGMQITLSHKTSTAVGDFGAAASTISLRLEGRKQWMAHNRLRFETSMHNVEVITSAFPSAVVEDTRNTLNDVKVLEATERVPATISVGDYGFVMQPLDFQLENFERFKDKPQWAIFSEQGTGKTKVAIDITCYRFLKGTVTGLIVLSSPKGVHAQWIEEQFPKHLWPSVKLKPYIWEGKKPPEWLGKSTPELQVISGNIDMVKGSGFKLLKEFAAHHRNKLMVLIDESDTIKSINSVRNKKVRELGAFTQQRGIMTGTPIAKDLTDEWAQFYFLNPDFIGHKYLTSFRAQFCVMGGFENRSVIAHKNVDAFKKLTAPHIFRATKQDLGLPPKVYDSVVFDLGPTQKRLIRELRDQFFASLSSGATVAVKTGAVLLMRMQQISNGYAVDENGTVNWIENPRLDALVKLREDITGPVVIWCRFKEDVMTVKKHFHNTAVTYYGDTKDADRAAAKAAFLNGHAREIIATAGSMGKGVDGLQTVCDTGIYYSNSYNAIDRWQSEDRIDRMGMKGTSTHFDLIGRGSPDRGVIANLKKKRDIASLALDDLKQIMESIE